jgi:hypothetical protein
MDSGCSRYIIYIKESFSTYSVLDEPIKVITASGAIIQAITKGIIQLKITLKGELYTVTLIRVLYIPGLAGSLISVLQL